MNGYADTVVLVTGAGRGAGRAIALAFAAQGARVAANDITPINLDETVRQAAAAGGNIRPFIADVAKKIPVGAMMDEVTAELGSIEVLVNCARVEPGGNLLSLDEWDWERTLAVNLKAPFLTTQAAGRRMRDAQGGVILNVVGRSKGRPGQAASLASLTGLIAFTAQAAAELGAYNIRVHAICAAMAGVDCAGRGVPAKHLARSRATPPAGDLPGWALYLCSKQAADLTGQVVQLGG